MNRERLAQIAVRNGALRATELLCAAQFESLHVPALYVSAQEALSLYATGRTTGIVMQLGSGSVNCVPLYEGCVVNQHIPHRVPFTGRDCVASMMRLLTDKGYDVWPRACASLVYLTPVARVHSLAARASTTWHWMW